MIPGLPGDRPYYRTVTRERMIEALLAFGWLFDLQGERAAEARLEAGQALDRLLALGLPQAEGTFDPVETMNGFRAAGRAGLDGTWQSRLIPNARRLVANRGDPDLPPDLGDLVQGTYRVTLRRHYHLTPGNQVRLRMALPLDLEGAVDLSCDVAGTEARRGEGWADFRLVVPASGEVDCRAEFVLVARGQAPDGAGLSPEERDLYCRPVEGLIRVTSRIRDLADRLAGAETDPEALVRRFLGFLQNDLKQGALAHYQLDPLAPADLVVDGGWYDCMAGAALLASLCRARDIPARLVWGYGLYRAGSGAHSWIEIWFETLGWTPFDLTSLELGGEAADPVWSGLFLGQLDHRMVVERLPRHFAGLGSLKLPVAWHLLPRVRDGTLIHDICDAVTGRVIYSEALEVEPV